MTSNKHLLKALLQAGLQINEPLEGECGGTLLHVASFNGSEKMVEFIVDNGAILDVENTAGVRPIDIAYESGRTNVCLLLANFSQDKSTVDEFPELMLERAITCEPTTNQVFVSVNGTAPSEKMLNWLKVAKGWTEVKARQEKESDGDKEAPHLYISIVRINGEEYSCKWSFERGRLSGRWTESNLRKKYGYWLPVHKEGGEF